VVIDYNRFPVRAGAGSAFFLHVTDGSATAGCVAVPQDTLVTLMRWLTPAAHPRILIGLG
jgi:L,D-peptidoglycan transpeptidase YkuD (ErfK/YbiS/YcfS/YnhG family)